MHYSLKFLPLSIFITFFILLFSACVPTGKLKDAEAKNAYLQDENLKLKNAKKNETEAKAKNADLEFQLQKTEDLLKTLNANYNGILSSYETLQLEYDKLSGKNRELLNTTAGEKSSLENELSSKQNELDRKLRELAEKEANIQFQTNELSKLNSTVAERELQIQELNANLEAQRFILNDLKSKLTNALSSYASDELQIEQKENGKVYISLSQKLLFSKGSSQVDQKGKEAILKLSEILKNNNTIEILVEGHTDSDGTVEKNWDLSVARATEVVKIIQSSGIMPERLTASGKALYAPVAPNDIEENKALNRRIEIILSPKLDKLYELINSK